jgi:hypothetical protein
MNGSILEAYMCLAKAYCFLDVQKRAFPEQKLAIDKIMKEITIVQEKLYDLRWSKWHSKEEE